MNRAEVYAWATGPPAPGPRATLAEEHHRGLCDGLTFLEVPCPRCAYTPIGFRKRCPACLQPRMAA